MPGHSKELKSFDVGCELWNSLLLLYLFFLCHQTCTHSLVKLNWLYYNFFLNFQGWIFHIYWGCCHHFDFGTFSQNWLFFIFDFVNKVQLCFIGVVCYPFYKGAQIIFVVAGLDLLGRCRKWALNCWSDNKWGKVVLRDATWYRIQLKGSCPWRI